jgi:hypothetical protein
MRSMLIAAALCCTGSYGFCQDTPKATEQKEVVQATTVQDIDMQIGLVKEQIAKYQGMALAFQRKTESMQFQDFENSRQSARMMEICQGIANDLNARLKELEQQKEKLLEKKSEQKK